MAKTQANTVSTPEVITGISSIWRVLFHDGIIIFSLLVFVEITLQLFWPYYSHQLSDYEYTGSYPNEVNEQGHRGLPIPVDREAGELRILALGDSVTWGTGVRAEDAWPAQLKEQLRNHLGGTINVINAAVPGSSVDALTKSYQQIWKKYDVEVVVFVATPNMVSRQWIDADAPLPIHKWDTNTSNWSAAAKLRVKANRLIHRFCIPSFLSFNTKYLMYQIGLLTHKMDPVTPYGPMLAYGLAQPDVPLASSDQSWVQFDDAVEHLQEILNQDGVRLICCFLEPRFAIWNTSRDNEKNVPRDRFRVDARQRFMQICRTQNIESVDLVDNLRSTRKMSVDSPDLFNKFDYNHLDYRGHRAVATALATYIESNP